jgi:hypothetical protein
MVQKLAPRLVLAHREPAELVVEESLRCSMTKRRCAA